MEDLILAVSSPPDIDLDVFSAWVDGRTVEEASLYKIDSLQKGGNQLTGLEFPSISSVASLLDSFSTQKEFIKYEINDQYNLFQLLEHYLSVPHLLKLQTLCIVPPELQSTLIDKYWSLDDILVREVLNRKLASKNRKDLEDISENTGLNIRRVTRQYDNLKKLLTFFDSDLSHGTQNIFHYVSQQYLLSHQLAKKYACVLFLLSHKFTLTSKRRLQRLPCDNLEKCGALILVFLCFDQIKFLREVGSFDISEHTYFENLQNAWHFVWKVFPLVDSYELDKTLLNNIRDLRSIISGEMLDQFCNQIRGRLAPGILRRLDGSTASNALTISSKLRNIVKSLLQLGANLSQSREFRDLLEDLITKIAEPLEETGLSMAEINQFIIACATVEFDSGSGWSSNGRANSLLRSGDVSTRSIDSTPSQAAYQLTTPRHGSRTDHLKRDWLRFITFTRLCLLQLLPDKRS